MAPRLFQLDLAQVEKAVIALQRYVGSQQQGEGGLLDDEDEFLYVMISLKESHPAHRKHKPVRIMLPHPIFAHDGCEVCLLVKDDATSSGHKAAKKRIRDYANNAGITKVLGTSKLRTKFESFEAKRRLCQQYDLFLADDRVLPSLPRLLGKQFFRKKKQPLAVKLTAKDWAAQIAKARECTPLILSGGSCVTLKVARVSFTAEQAVENVRAAMEAAVQSIPKKGANIQGVFLKTADSVALPVFQTLPKQATRI